MRSQRVPELGDRRLLAEANAQCTGFIDRIGHGTALLPSTLYRRTESRHLHGDATTRERRGCSFEYLSNLLARQLVPHGVQRCRGAASPIRIETPARKGRGGRRSLRTWEHGLEPKQQDTALRAGGSLPTRERALELPRLLQSALRRLRPKREKGRVACRSRD